ncbi:MAG: hypothetical protein JNK75_11250 [Betaproteobacteria bacterium]|nr:hypothetical protein [Betaproteobacteria bacterium]
MNREGEAAAITEIVDLSQIPQKTHFSPLVDTIGKQKPAVKRVLRIFSLFVRDLRVDLQSKSLWKTSLIINEISEKPKVTSQDLGLKMA